MSYEIMIQNEIICNHQQLIEELNSLVIQGVRTYSIIGGINSCIGVYAWDDNAPIGEYHHIEVSESDKQLIVQKIESHVAIFPPPLLTQSQIEEILTAQAEFLIALDNKLNGGVS